MKTLRWSMFVLTCAAVTFAVVELWASGPVAVYAIVDKVVFEPNEANPQRIQIWGAFSLETEPYGSKYTAAQRGYLYYKVDSTTTVLEQAVRATWTDLKKVAGTGEAIGFGGGYAASGSGRIRKAADKPDRPDVFPIGNPVVKLGSAQADVVARLKAALPAK